MEENFTPGEGNTDPQAYQQNLPNATAVLVLGILSIVLCFCYGVIGIILGVIALIMAGKDMKLYQANPDMYTESSFKNIKTGRICAIIGLSLSVLYLVYVIVIFSTVGMEVLQEMPWDQF